MLIKNILGRGLRAVHYLPHPLDDLGGVDWCELLDEFIVRNMVVIVVVKVSEQLVNFFIDEADAEASQFMVELLFRESVVWIGVDNVKQDRECNVIYNQVVFNFPPCLK